MTTQTDVIEKQILIRARRERVWRAISSATEFGAWFLARFDGDFAPGTHIKGEMTYPGYEGSPIELWVEEVVPETLFSFRWHPYDIDAESDNSSEPTTLVSFRLEDAPEGTLLTLTESGFDALPADRKAKAFQENSQGWDEQLQNVMRYVTAGN